MKFRIPKKSAPSVYQLIRKAGYFPITSPQTKQTSFIRKLSSQRYPRFHLYVSENSAEIVFDLHLDQTAARYQGQTAHRADYNSPLVKEELTRIYQAISSLLRS
jgi:predicted deacylase